MVGVLPGGFPKARPSAALLAATRAPVGEPERAQRLADPDRARGPAGAAADPVAAAPPTLAAAPVDESAPRQRSLFANL